MARKLSSVQKIIALNPIANADNLELAQVLGWNCIVKKGDFKVGDKCLYYEIDSLIPISPEYEFLRKNCYKKTDFGEGFRIKTIRLRGQISQGLAVKLPDIFKDLEEGEDLTEKIGVKLYNPPIPECLKGFVKGAFPSFMPKTDETRVQVLQDCLTRHKGIKCYVTEKVDGTSVTYFVKDGVFGVCSRNLEMLDSKCVYWDLAKELKIEEKLKSLNKNIMIQGEIVGTGIQGNSLKLDHKEVLFFNAFDIDKYRYMDYLEFWALFKTLDLQTVPIVTANFDLIDDVPLLIKMATRKSIINPHGWAEGIVIRPVTEKMDMQLAQGFGNGRLSFKAINPIYLVEHDD